MNAAHVILHLGLGAFHRAHQAVFLQRLIDAGDHSWSLAGGNIRPDGPEQIAALVAQAGTYTLETVAPDGMRQYQKIFAIKTVVPFDPVMTKLMRIGADPATRIISFTVTEAGYYLDDKNQLDLSHADIATDLACGQRERSRRTIYGALAAILHARRDRCRDGNEGNVTLLCCDNLRHNGNRFLAGMMQYLAQAGDAALLDWVTIHTTCPNAMVDRITPRPVPAVRARVKAATGWDDAAPVMAESFIQWVIEDNFCNGRPPWQHVGVEMVASVAPFEEAKLRILNASHSCLAWAGTLAGHEFIHEGARDPRIRQAAFDYITDDAIPCLRPSPVDLEKYRDVVLARFGNAALGDTNQRVAMDGFAKLPGFIVPTIAERLQRHESIASVSMLPALFLAFLQRWHRGELAYAYEDQAMDAAAAHAICATSDPVNAFCTNAVLWGGLAGDARLVAAIRAAGVGVTRLFSTVTP
jgi:D-arabinitol 4-dehydrogenase